MSIDEAIVKLNSLIQLNICPNLFNEIIEWLEELKAMRNLDKTNFSDGYNKGIDDAVKVIENSKSIFDNSRHCSMGEKDRLQNLIKKLKAGGKNDD